MRNLKRALSLALASVMLVGMMVVGTSAASYPDVDSNDNVEAISVLQAVGVMQGDGDTGEFRPNDQVSRNEMAVIMARLLLGPDADSYVGTHPFTDVPAWADKYVAACYNDGIIKGTSDTTYSGTATVTAQEAAAMMLRALGYEKLEESGADWARRVVSKANEIRLFADVGSNPNAAMTRNQIAQLGLNTLEATMVTTESGANINLGDIGSITTDVKYTEREVDVTSTSDAACAISGPASISGSAKVTLQLGEWLYDGDLKKGTGDDDDFGRPADYKWKYKGNDSVYNVVKSASVVFTAKTSEDDVLKAIKGYTFGSAGKVTDKTSNASGSVTLGDLSLTTSGSVVAQVATATGNGKLVEIFVDGDKNVEDVVIVQYTVGKVTKISTNKDGDVTYTIDNGGGTKKDYADPDKDDQIVIDGSIEEDDIVTFVSKGSPAVLYVYPTTSFTGAQSAYNINKATITVDGETYDVGNALTNVTISGGDDEFPNSSDEATFYVDQYGFVVKSDAIAEDTDWAIVDEIIYVQGSGLAGSKYAEAKLVFPDGTSKTVKVTEINGKKMKDGVTVTTDGTAGFLDTDSNGDVEAIHIDTQSASANAKLANAIVKYSEKNGEYKLTYVDLTDDNNDADNMPQSTYTEVADTQKATTKGVPGFGGTVAVASGNNDTIYVIKTGDDKWSTYTGYKNVPTVTAGSNKAPVVYVTKDSGAVELVYVDASLDGTTTGDSSKDVFFVTNKDTTTTKDGDDNIVILTGILNGEEGDLKIKSGDTFSIDGTGSKTFADVTEDVLYEVESDGDGYVTVMTTQGGAGKTYVSQSMTAAKEETAGVVAGKSYDDDTVVYVIDGDDVSEGGVTDAREGDLIYIKVKGDSGADAETIEVMYVIKDKAEAEAPVAPKALTWTQGTNTVSATVAAGDPTWTTALSVTVNEEAKTITVAGVGTGKDLADNDTVVFTLTASEGASFAGHNDNGGNVTVSSGTVTLKYSSGWPSGQKLTVTASDSSTVDYTITCTVSSTQ